MFFLNHYSVAIVWGLLALAGLAAVLRPRANSRQLISCGVLLVLATAGWWFLRPVARLATPPAGKPYLLELQSPFCIACLAQKPKMDALERELAGRLIVLRVNIQSTEGKTLSARYGIERTPSFIFFDSEGGEVWRVEGGLEPERVRQSLTSPEK